ncbi:hypothetical protein COX25_00700 [bacterium (Candidatus Howlettbacteria) CG23_combo_of_CG06-09_8_20_14_all_37_9]|nr:MAG: hypothetical protein COX25_00700 [bacterium (Candidatus Howlettbacteria) CG23_combo_of_CG06-09_8_20_14_all_37_9]
MGHFDGMENKNEKEIYYKKFISAFISLVEDHLSKESSDSDQDKNALMPTAMPTAVRNCKP